MSPGPLAAGVIALAGNFVLSLGMVLQKRHVSWLGHKGERGAAFRRDRLGWSAGLVLINIVPAFNFVALLGLPPAIVGAAAGSSVAFTALLSSAFLGERLGARRAAWTAALFAAMAAAALLGREGSGAFAAPWLYVFALIPIVAAALALPARMRRPGPLLAVVLAGIAGAFAGFMVLPMRALQLEAGAGILSWLSRPYLWLYLVAGVGGFTLTQFAYKDGRMSSVSPAYYGLTVLWPALASYFVFGAPFAPLQALAFAAIALCVAMVARSPAG